jgi:hypothetical protein
MAAWRRMVASRKVGPHQPYLLPAFGGSSRTDASEACLRSAARGLRGLLGCGARHAVTEAGACTAPCSLPRTMPGPVSHYRQLRWMEIKLLMVDLGCNVTRRCAC